MSIGPQYIPCCDNIRLVHSDLFASVDRLGRLSMITRIHVPRPKPRECKSFNKASALKSTMSTQWCTQVTRLYTIRDLGAHNARSSKPHLLNTASITHPHTVKYFLPEVERHSKHFSPTPQPTASLTLSITFLPCFQVVMQSGNRDAETSMTTQE